MAAKVKISEFVASTKRYAKKAALAADKDKNNKLSKTEAKGLPKDLRDDYARQAKTKSVITPAGFAQDQAAYVAASAKQADADGDGLLSAAEAKNLPRSLKNNYADYVANAGTQSTPAAGGFVGKGKGKVQTLGGKSFTNLPVSASVQKLVAKLATDSTITSAYAAAFKGKPADLAAALGAKDNAQFFNDLLFRATGTTYDIDYPDYYVPSQLSVSEYTAAQALQDVQGDFSGSTAPTASAVPADVKALFDAMAMKGPGVKFYKLLWTNHDDASFYATVAANASTGEIRAIGQVNEP